MRAWFRKRYLDVLGSIYIYNEHRGYTAIDDLLAAVRARWPDDHELIAKIEKHRADEHKHYLMFRRWFERRGVMPYALDKAFGHIDRFVSIMFGKGIDDLDKLEVVSSDDQFGRMCRVISLTERRGYKQVEILLKNSHVLSDATLAKIFRIIEQDEPSHWAPYDEWLDAHGGRRDRWWERKVDSYIHSELLFLKLPMLFLAPLARCTRFADEEDGRGEPAAMVVAGAH
jgi:rubrerythrin